MKSFEEIPGTGLFLISKENIEFLLSKAKGNRASLPPISDFPPNLKEILTVDDAANLTGLAKQTIYTKVSRREIPHYKASRKVYFKRTELVEWMLEEKRDTHSALQAQAADFIENQKAKRNKQ